MAFSDYDLNDSMEKAISRGIDQYFEANSFWTSIMGNERRYPIYTVEREIHSDDSDVKERFQDLLQDNGVRDVLSMGITQQTFGNCVAESLYIENDTRKADRDSFISDVTAALADWYRRMFDRKVFVSLSHNCTNIAAFSRTTPTGLYQINPNQTTQDLCGQIQATDTFNLRSLRQALRRVYLGIDHKGERHPHMRPYQIHMTNTEGISISQNVFIAVLHPMQIMALYDDPDFIARTNRYGMQNPLISGQIGMIDNCIIVDGGAWNDKLKEAGILTSAVPNIEDELNRREIVDRGVTQMSVYAGDGGQLTACGLLLGKTSMLCCGTFKSRVYTENKDRKRIAFDVSFGMRKTHYAGYTDKEKENTYYGKDFSCMALVSAI